VNTSHQLIFKVKIENHRRQAGRKAAITSPKVINIAADTTSPHAASTLWGERSCRKAPAHFLETVLKFTLTVESLSVGLFSRMQPQVKERPREYSFP
jgi:hypothetical protein